MLKRKVTLANKLGWALLLLAALTLAGCLEEKSEYTINPDGSGKMVYNVTYMPTSLNRGPQKAVPESEIIPEIRSILQKSEGVDVWSNISFESSDDGVHFTGTAYFPDINKLNIRAGGFSKDMRLHLAKDQSGRITVELRRDSDSRQEDAKAPAAELSEADVAKKAEQTRLQYSSTKKMMQSMLKDLKSDTLLHLPGRIEETSNFEKIDNTTAGLTMEGGRIIDGMERMMADDDWLKEQIRANRNPLRDRPDDLVFNEMLFGQKAPVRVVLRGGAADLFDYDSEVAAAKDSYGGMLEELGLGQVSPAEAPAPPTVPSGPGTVRVGGVRLVRYYDKERGIRPLNYPNDYTLSLILELPEPNMAITRGRVERAITNTGENIVPEPNPGIPFPKLSTDGTAAVFDVKLSVPEPGTRGLTELAGSLEYLKWSGTKKIDLGVMDFKAGAESSVEGFSIKSVRVKDYDKEYTYMHLKVNLVRGSVKSVKFYSEDGTELEVSPAGRSYSQGRVHDIGYKIKGQFPPRGRIVFEVLDNVTKDEIPFRLTRISLAGEQVR
jgi:hypothetical protein